MGGRSLRIVGAILFGIFWGRRGPDLARGDEPVPKQPAAAPAAAPSAAAKSVPGTGTLTGVVRTADGPTAGARVAVYRHAPRTLDLFVQFDEDAFALRFLHPTSVEPSAPEVAADRDGRFRFEGLPQGRYEVLARAADGEVVGRRWPAEVWTGREESLGIVLDKKAGTLAGTVNHADGRPFEGYVFASFEADGSFLPLPYGGIPSRIAPDGSFRFEALPADPCWVYAVAPGRAAVLAFGGKRHAAWQPDARVDLVVDSGASSVDVLVVDAGTRSPVPGATVRSTSQQETIVRWSEAITDSKGKAALPGWTTIRATVPGYAAGEKDIGEAKSLTLELRREGTVRGVVRGPDGAGVEGVSVHVVGVGNHIRGSTRSAPGGAYELSELPPSMLGIFALGDGWVPPDAFARTQEPIAGVPLDLRAQAVATVDLAVVRGAQARVLVESPDHRPIAGAVVSQGTPRVGRSGTLWVIDELGPEPSATGADGIVELRGLIPGLSYPVGARASGFVEGRGAVVPSVEVVAATTLTLEPGRTITIDLRERGTGAPIRGAEVVLLAAPKGGADLRQRAEARTGADGRVVFHGLPRTLSACAIEAPLHVTARQTYRPIPDSDSDAPELMFEVDLERGLAVTGRMRRADGKTLYVPSVSATPVDATDAPSVRPWRLGRVDPDGVFVLEGLAPGRYRLEAQDLLEDGEGDSIDAALEVEDGAEGVEITLPRAPAPESRRRARLVVLTPDGKPVAYAYTEIWGGGGSISNSNVKDGVLEFEPWTGATLDGILVDIANASDAAGRALPFGPVHFGPGVAGAVEAEVHLPPGAVVEGRVVDPEGRPVAGVGITARPEAVDAKGSPAWRVTRHGVEKTGLDGRFLFIGLAAEPYSFTLEVPTGFAAGPRVRVNAPVSEVMIRLERSVDVVLTVLDASGAPAMGAEVTAEPDGEGSPASVTAIVDAAGHARLVGLHPTRPYTLEIEPAARSTGLLTFRREGWIAREGTVRLAAAGTVTGTVVDADGRPWPGASVRWWVDGKEQRDVVADAAGRFELRNLGPGEIVLSAFGGEGRRDPEPELAGPRKTVPVGSADVTLTAPRGVELTVRIAAPDPDAWKGSSAWVSRLHPTNLAGAKIHAVTIGADGTFRSGPLVTGARYAIWVPVGRTGLTALKADVVGAAGELVLTPVAGQTIRGRVVADTPLNAPSRWIDAYGTGWSLRTHFGADGRFEFQGVPDGSCVLRGEATIGDVYHTGLLRGVRPGADVEVRIEPEK